MAQSRVQVADMSGMERQAFEKTVGKVLGGRRLHVQQFHYPRPGHATLQLASADAAIEARNALQKDLALAGMRVYVKKGNRRERQRKREQKREKGAVQKRSVLDQELDAVKSKYGAGAVIVMVNRKTGNTDVMLDMVPSAPDFPYDLGGPLQLKIRVPPTYPAERCEWRVLNDIIPDDLKQQMATAIHMRSRLYLNKPSMLRSLLRYVDINMEKLMVRKRSAVLEVVTFSKPAAPKDGNSRYTEEALNPTLHRKSGEQQADSDSNTNNNNNDNETSNDNAGDNAGDNDSGEDDASAPTKLLPVASSRLVASRHFSSKWQLSVLGVRMHGAGVMTNVSLACVLCCARCKKDLGTQKVPQNQLLSSTCLGCTSVWGASWQPTPMHPTDLTFGVLQLDGCTLHDALPSTWNVQCMECGEGNKVKNLSAIRYTNCRKCHTKMQLGLEDTQMQLAQEGLSGDFKDNLRQKRRQAAQKKKARKALIKPGEALPNFGTCKHAKKSKRWFRFPCCKRAFPCDSCHNDEMDHPAMRAPVFICGFCSRTNQIRKGKELTCQHCEQTVVKAIRSHHWEGGKGQRDKNRMNRNDKKKYAGLNKTSSRKDERVGPKDRD